MFKNAQLAGLKRFGKNKWCGHVADVVKRLKAALEANDVVDRPRQRKVAAHGGPGR